MILMLFFFLLEWNHDFIVLWKKKMLFYRYVFLPSNEIKISLC